MRNCCQLNLLVTAGVESGMLLDNTRQGCPHSQGELHWVKLATELTLVTLVILSQHLQMVYGCNWPIHQWVLKALATKKETNTMLIIVSFPWALVPSEMMHWDNVYLNNRNDKLLLSITFHKLKISYIQPCTPLKMTWFRVILIIKARGSINQCFCFSVC